MQPGIYAVSDLLDKALAQLERELLEAKTQRDTVESEYRAIIKPLNDRVRALESAVHHQRDAVENYGGTRRDIGPSEIAEKLTDVAYRALRTNGEPMHYRRIVEHLASLGVSLSGKDPGTVLINYLRREPQRFCRTGQPGCYALVEWNLPGARPVSGAPKTTPSKKRRTRAASPLAKVAARKPRGGE